MLKKSILIAIKIYQRTLSPDHGIARAAFPFGACRFSPTCSEYTYQAIERFGTWKGVFMGGKRIIRCHPWNKGGADPVPPK